MCVAYEYEYLVWGLCSAPTGDMLPSWARGGRMIDLHMTHRLCWHCETRTTQDTHTHWLVSQASWKDNCSSSTSALH